MRETLTAGLQKPATFIRSARSFPKARRSAAAMPGDGANVRKPGLGASAPDDDDVERERHGRRSGRSAVTAIFTLIRNASVRGATFGKAIRP